jgi:hypothetical protein
VGSRSVERGGASVAGVVPEIVTIDAPFYGFPGVGLGGYAAGLLADRIPGSLQATLRKAPPLARPLQLQVTGEGAASAGYPGFVAHPFPMCLT